MLDICCKNLSNKLSDLFSSYVKESSKIVYSHGGYNWWDDDYDGYDGWYGDEWNDSFNARDFTNVRSINHSCHNDGDDYYPSYRQKSFKKSSKRGVRGGKKYKGVTVYDSDALNASDDLPFCANQDNKKVESDITIYFYDDILNPDSRRTFHSLYDFEEFVDSENIYISSTDQAALLRNNVSHCCKDPNFSSTSNPWLITDPTYGGLRWLSAANQDDLYYE